jgi:hypothetical protein
VKASAARHHSSDRLQAEAFVQEATQVRDAAFDESDSLERQLEEAGEKAADASRAAAEVQVEGVTRLVAAASEAFRDPPQALALLAQAWTALEFANKVRHAVCCILMYNGRRGGTAGTLRDERRVWPGVVWGMAAARDLFW